MRIIDAHAHLMDHRNYLEKLIDMMDNCGIEKCCLSGLGELFRCKSNEDVERAFNRYPERIIGVYFIRPGIHNNKEVQEAYEKGFKMLKVSIPTKPYDDLSFFPLWETAEELKLPILFHTGIVTFFRKPTYLISSWFMHPMRLETIANSFPDLNMIIAHLGIHWNKDAAELLRMKKNVYADLTGEPNGWRVRMDQEGLKKYLWWPKAFKKILFGTDVHYKKIPDILKQDKARLDKQKISSETRELFFSKNIINLLGM
jgi:predicted TIM-barrel fold metal-dependent hydrolase